jgi:molecular chaperone DnaK (HSP70)
LARPNTVVAKVPDDNTGSAVPAPEIVEICGKLLCETAIRLDGHDREVEQFGNQAWEDAVHHPAHSFLEFKLFLGTGRPCPSLSGTRVKAEFLSELYLRKIREELERHFGNCPLPQAVSRVVVGHPASWNSAQRRETIRLLEAAGFPHVEGFEEPLACVKRQFNVGTLSDSDQAELRRSSRELKEKLATEMAQGKRRVSVVKRLDAALRGTR